MQRQICSYVPQCELLNSVEDMNMYDGEGYMSKLKLAYEKNYTDVIRALYMKKISSCPDKDISIFQKEIMMMFRANNRGDIKEYCDILKEIFEPYLGFDLFNEYFEIIFTNIGYLIGAAPGN